MRRSFALVLFACLSVTSALAESLGWVPEPVSVYDKSEVLR